MNNATKKFPTAAMMYAAVFQLRAGSVILGVQPSGGGAMTWMPSTK